MEDLSSGFYLSALPELKSYKNISDYKAHFTFSDNDWELLNTVAASDSLSLTTLSPGAKTAIISELKAELARLLWSDEGYYEVHNTDDKVIAKAIEVLNK